jgi:hypothetical protein
MSTLYYDLPQIRRAAVPILPTESTQDKLLRWLPTIFMAESLAGLCMAMYCDEDITMLDVSKLAATYSVIYLLYGISEGVKSIDASHTKKVDNY